MSVISVDSFVKKFGEHIAVDDISFDVKEGEIVSLLGPSGCGKSTTLRCIAGIDQLTSGEIRIDGEVVSSSDPPVHVPPARRKLGMVFQSFALWPNKNVMDNIKFGLEQRPDIDMSEQEMVDRVHELLEKADLAGYEEKYPRNLSGGEQQRVALARSLAYSPKVLLLDEPLSNLDAKLREEARIWLQTIHEEIDISMLYVTHDQAEACSLSDRIIILNDGKIEQIGTPREVFTNPTNSFVADFIGKGNFINGTVDVRSNGTTTLVTENQDTFTVTSPTTIGEGERATISISPEDIDIIGNGDHADESNVILGSVSQILYLGNKTELILETANQPLTVRELGFVDYEEGDSIAVKLPPEKCALIAA